MALPPGRRVLTPAEKKFYAEMNPQTPQSDLYRQMRELRGTDAAASQPSLGFAHELSDSSDPRLLPPRRDNWNMIPLSTTGSLPSHVSRSRTRNEYRPPREAPSLGRAPSSLASMPSRGFHPYFGNTASHVPCQSAPQQALPQSAPQPALPLYLDAMRPSTIQQPCAIYDQRASQAPPSFQLGSTTVASTPQSTTFGSAAHTANLHAPQQSDESLRRLADLLLESLTRTPPTLPAPAAQATIIDLSTMPPPPPLWGAKRPAPTASLGLPEPSIHVKPQSPSPSLPEQAPLLDPDDPPPAKKLYEPAVSDISIPDSLVAAQPLPEFQPLLPSYTAEMDNDFLLSHQQASTAAPAAAGAPLFDTGLVGRRSRFTTALCGFRRRRSL